ncbi:hypothetical protein PhCBS80983_g05990 [Powellomyces hirtus]|uniref:Las1-domain-containing protein n=1 Tax=Powellomyces hirtus TaxID=109895 RepID=A0A507DTG2_9FUNG|nr:hypothetical protein PhCBS80983_g05990 [Powellomyces hirtus]
MPSRQLRSVPWATQLEWEDVFAGLYADDGPQSRGRQEWGVKRVKAWTSRGKVPHAVDSTASLVEVWLRDGCGGAYGPPPVSEHEIRLMYTMAFIRFVNGVVDANQRGMYATSVASIADQLGLPGWFVDLRHAGTHDTLPTLPLLRNGCKQALQWLRSNYWILQKTYLANTATEVRTLLTRYKVAMKQKAKGTEPPTLSIPTLLSEITTLTTSDNYNDVLLPSLLDIGFLVPTAIKKRADLPMIALPTSLESLWADALACFEHSWPGFAEDLVLQIVEVVTTPPSSTEVQPQAATSYQATMAGWAHYCLLNYILPKPSGWEVSLEACLRRPNVFTRYLVAAFADARPALADKLQPFIQAFLDQQNPTRGEPFTPPLPRPPPSAAINHISPPCVSNVPKPAPKPTPTWTPSPWTLVPAHWYRRPAPIGCLPDGRVPDLDLPDWFDTEGEVLVQTGVVQLPVCHAGTVGQMEVDEQPPRIPHVPSPRPRARLEEAGHTHTTRNDDNDKTMETETEMDADGPAPPSPAPQPRTTLPTHLDPLTPHHQHNHNPRPDLQAVAARVMLL